MSDDPLDLFEEYRRTRRRDLRNRIVEEHMGLAIHIARRFRNRVGKDDDLDQVAMIALVRAVDRFDPTRGVPFAGFAGATIEGEIKRYFRDSTWGVKVPRSAQELHLAVRRGIDELSAELGRSPTVAETALHLGLDQDRVITGLVTSAARTIGPIDRTDDDGVSNDMTSSVESGYEAIDNEAAVHSLIATLPEREQSIVRMLFFENMVQSEIATRVGVSQMHVSRLLRAALEHMRSVAEHELPGDR
jgi:RNA polymerase sigma-B factor